MKLNIYGLIIMISSWTLITGIFVYCYYKVLKTEKK